MAEEYRKIIADKKNQAKRLMNQTQILRCNIAIHTASAASAAAGVIPIPVMDAVPITIAQITMVISLGKIFDTKVTESVAKGLIGAAASTFVGRSLVKAIPIVGWGISAVVAAGVTEAIGWTIAVDFAKDAKNRWEQECNSSADMHQANDVFESTCDSPNAEEENASNENSAESLCARADMFISGKKKRSEYESEYLALLEEIEKVLDALPHNDPLRQMYDDLCLIIE